MAAGRCPAELQAHVDALIPEPLRLNTVSRSTWIAINGWGCLFNTEADGPKIFVFLLKGPI